MSAKVTIWAWKQAAGLGPKEGPLLLTFLALADMARETGKVWASHGYLAGKAHQSARTIRANIETLEGRGFLRTEPTPGRPDVIWLNLTAMTLFENGGETDEPGALEKGPRRPRQEMPTSGSAPPAGGVGAKVGDTSAGGADKPRTEPRKRTEAIASDTRGTRLPEGWEPEPNIATLIGLSVDEAAEQLERFRDYWAAQPGAKGRKADWMATWRNWCRTALERRNGRGSPATRTAAGGVDFAAERAAARVDAMVDGARQAVTGGRRRWQL